MCLTCYDGAWYPAVAGAQPADGGERQVCQQEGGRLHQEQVSHPSWLYILNCLLTTSQVSYVFASFVQ